MIILYSFLHTFFLFSRFHLDMPIYVNMVRDPVERVISWYYYVRAPWYFVERKRAFPDLPLPNTNWLKKVRIDQHNPFNRDINVFGMQDRIS